MIQQRVNELSIFVYPFYFHILLDSIHAPTQGATQMSYME